MLFSVQSASVPPNLLTLPERVFEEQENRWLLQIRTEVRDLLADPLFDGLEVEPKFSFWLPGFRQVYSHLRFL